MTKEESREASAAAKSEHVRLKNIERERQAIRDHERARLAALVSPGTDAHYDDTGFSDGLL